MNVPAQDKKFLRSLGLRIRSLRTARGWTLEQTEEYGDLSWRHLQKIEAGKNVTALTLKRISLLYQITLSDLLKDL